MSHRKTFSGSLLFAFAGACLLVICLCAFAQQPTTTSINGVRGQTIATMGVLPLFNLDGTPIANGRCAQGIVTSSATTGQWTANYSALGFSTITSFRANVLSPTTSLTALGAQYTVSMQSATATIATGTVMAPAIVAIGGYGISFGAAAAQVSVNVCGY